MSLGTALSGALSGLQIHQQQIDVIANNVSNVGTPGFTRKILPQSTDVISGRSIGVRAETIIRKVDFNVVRDIFTQVSTTNYYETRVRYLDSIQAFHGAPDREVSIAAEISQLKDSFSALADAPEDTILLSSAAEQANTTATRINELADLLQTLRNDTQSDIDLAVSRMNDLLEQIANVNGEIRTNNNIGRTVAGLEDKRDQAVKELSQEIDISFFIRGDGVMVVQTASGVELVSDRAEELGFAAVPISSQNYYGDSRTAGLVVNPDSENPIDITSQIENGNVGALLELRDQTLPTFAAQLDELAHKLALRFQAQGLRLFTDETGSIPLDTPPDPNSTPPLAVAYVGFSQEIQVNPLIVENNELLRTGTYTGDEPVQKGSNEVIRRILEFTFTDVSYQEAQGIRNLDTDAIVGTDNLQDLLGLASENEIRGTRDLNGFTEVNTLIAAANGQLDPPNDTFTIEFSDPDLGLGTDTVTIDLSVAAGIALGPGDNAADQLLTHITAQLGGVDAGYNATAAIGSNGQLIIRSRGDIAIDGAGGIEQTGLEFLGLTTVSQEATDPWFEVQVGNDPVQRITIEPGDDEDALLEKLRLDAIATPGDTDGVAGLGVNQTTLLGATGELIIRPGNGNAATYDGFSFGGDLKIFGGPFETDGTGTHPDAIPGGVGVIEALFGTGSPIAEVNYGSETSQNQALSTSSGVFVSFRENFLGPSASMSTEILGATSLIDYSQRMINKQSEKSVLADARLEDERTFQQIIERQFLDQSGVNVDEELSQLILVQNAYASSARVLNAVDEMFRDLLNSL